LLTLLQELGYLSGWKLTPKGETLRVIYNELDLLVTEAAASGHLAGLSAAELAGIATMFVYEPRRDDLPGGMPSRASDDAAEAVFELSNSIAQREDAHKIEMMRPPNDGYVERMHDWASGASLDDLFDDDDGAAGDFVRIARQTLDLLRQIRDAFPALRDPASTALGLVDRGVVAAESRW
jgi:ATP-dependent RNA helicase HelY